MNSIDFENLVNNEFKFLENKYGFSCVSSSLEAARYESSDIFVAIRYDANRSYELGVEIGQLKALFNGQERPFSLNEVLRIHKLKEAGIHSAVQASSHEAVANCLTKMASQLSQYGSDLLSNDVFAYKRLAVQREKECNDYELQTKLLHIRSDAQTAWKNKDYKQVIALFEPVKDELSDAELKKLNYAQKKIGTP
ncbi:hypothetical protein [Pseudoalteromonas rubra]|uniref:Uncharacterized protein n=1 Tax=Pseudoalteromonas rubra TaxID=43658 RepID=A0A5S3WVC1_9GAMM|nr:hypothetical protein [Pseudoalteromonas rubra]TMP32586.1 hypothetical protein CWB98_21570 [Pseudoalteromonas rubra]